MKKAKDQKSAVRRQRTGAASLSPRILPLKTIDSAIKSQNDLQE